MNTRKQYLIVTTDAQGEPQYHAMKKWLREHPEQMPQGFTSRGKTSVQLKGELKRLGWNVEVTEDEVRISKPLEDLVPAIVAKYQESDVSEPDIGQEDEELAFSLESHLRDFIAHNLSTLPVKQKRLKLFVGPEQQRGIEYSTGVGPIDILAVDGDGNFVVFELKLARGPDKVIGQVLRYMGWVKQHLAVGKTVTGVIVAKDISEKLRYAALPVPDVSLLEYEFDFRLKPAALT